MALSGEERSERATPKRRSEARKRGEVARSADVNAVASLGASLAALVIFGPRILGGLEEVVRHGLLQAGDPQLASRDALVPLVKWVSGAFAAAAAPVVLAAAAGGVLASAAQVGLRLTPKAMQPSFKKLNPLKGLKRVFGPSGLVEAAKAMAKTAVVGAVAILAVQPELPKLASLVGLPPEAILGQLASTVLSVSLRTAAALAVVAVLDYAWQRRRHEKSLRMTKEEVRQESRQSDVSPELRKAIRRRQFESARTRMLADVPGADVVVVNPTHYAVALRYDGKLPAPEVVARGIDFAAAAIRAVAEEHDVPIITNPPLARALYRDVELGRVIPEELFAAVAEVLAFVYRRYGRLRRAG
jgi:flagellar biosynthetic protein FlhB